MKQHKTPCAKCPFRRNALRGWLGGLSADEFAQMAHAEVHMFCHTSAGSEGAHYGTPEALRLPQCAGRAVYWANQSHLPRDSSLLLLPADREAVFQRRQEFIEHHTSRIIVDQWTVGRKSMEKEMRVTRAKLDTLTAIFTRLTTTPGVTVVGRFGDLLVPVNAITKPILEQYPLRKAVHIFELADGPWYEIPCAYLPYWEMRARRRLARLRRSPAAVAPVSAALKKWKSQ
jgi:hypothetical protein